MKRFLSGLLCVCILLSGCAGDPPLPTQTDPPETQTQPSTPAVPLLEQGIAVGESGNLLYIPNDAVEDMNCPEVRLFGNGLLLSAFIRNQYVIRHISLEDGALLNECAISASPGVKLRIGNGSIGLLDKAGRILYTGDGLNTHLWMQLDHSLPISTMLETFRKLKAEHGQDFDYVAHGHTKVLRDKEILDWMIQGCEDILAGRTDKEMDYQYFGGVCRQHPISGTPGEVIVYNEGK